jgi:hypothetical protein
LWHELDVRVIAEVGFVKRISILDSVAISDGAHTGQPEAIHCPDESARIISDRRIAEDPAGLDQGRLLSTAAVSSFSGR